jgi:type IV secretion system protein VirD4
MSAMTAGRGLHLGHFWDEKTGRFGDREVYEGSTHALVFGPSGTGKGTRFLMVNLLSDCLDDRSVIVIDPKGELAAVTAWHRHHALGHDVRILDPFGKLHDAVKDSPTHRDFIAAGLTKSTGFNPLRWLDPQSRNFYDDAAAIGEALIKIEGKDPHWSESAQGLMVGLIMWEKIRNGDAANLENVRELLTTDLWEPYTDSNGKQRERIAGGLRFTAQEMVKHGGYEIASLASRFDKEETEETSGIRSAADTQTRWILSEPIRADLKAEPGIDFRTLKTNKKPTTVYVILPAERMRTHSVWLRLVIVSALRALYRPRGLRTMILIDEMAALGHLGPLEDAFGLVRGYGVQIAGFLQDLGQLKALYSERWESFVANAGVVQGLTPNDLTTAEWMSRRSGQTTARSDSLSSNTGMSPGGQSTGETISMQLVGRPKFFPHELFSFAPGTGLVWIAGSGIGHSIKFAALPYFEIPQCKGRALWNPYSGE